MEYTQYGKGYGAVPADSSTRTRVTLALALRGQGSFNATNQHLNARELFAYLAVAGGTQYAERYDETTPNSELIGIFDGHVVECFEKDERPRVLAVLKDAKSVLATTTLAKTPSQVVDDLEAFVRHCGFKEKGDGTLEALSEGRQGDWLSPRGGVQKFLYIQCEVFGVGKTWINWKKKAPDWAPLTAAGRPPSWGSKPPWWLAATAAAHKLIDARARLNGVSDEVRDTEKKAAKQAAFIRYYLKVAEELIKFEVAALEGLSDAKIMERVARRAKALDARKSAGSLKGANASVAAGSIPKAAAALKKAQAQSIAQGTNLSESRKKKPGGLVPYNAEDGFARQRDRKACFEPADATDWLD
jgi:hypothetical protein